MFSLTLFGFFTAAFSLECQCNGDRPPNGLDLLHDEEIAKWHWDVESGARSGDFDCVGWCSGAPGYVFHEEGNIIQKMQVWRGGGVPAGGIGRICIWFFGMDPEQPGHCVGSNKPQATMCPTFQVDHINSGQRIVNMSVATNNRAAPEKRLGYLKIDLVNQQGDYYSWSCGELSNYDDPTVYPGSNVKGKMLSGIFGFSGSDVGLFGGLLREPLCEIESGKITNMECLTKNGTACLANWHAASTKQQLNGAATCNACKTTSPVQCQFSFDFSETHSVSTSSSKLNELGGSYSFSRSLEVEFLPKISGSISDTFGVHWSTSESWTETKSVTTSHHLGSSCTTHTKPGSKVEASAAILVGSMEAYVQLTVDFVTKCGQKYTDTVPATIGLDNIGLLATVSDCTYKDVAC